MFSVWVGNKLGTLTVKTATTAEWMWDNNPVQLLTAISNSDKTGAGWYSTLNPFDDTIVLIRWKTAVVIANAQSLSPHEELTADLLSIIHCFSSRP